MPELRAFGTQGRIMTERLFSHGKSLIPARCVSFSLLSVILRGQNVSNGHIVTRMDMSAFRACNPEGGTFFTGQRRRRYCSH